MIFGWFKKKTPEEKLRSRITWTRSVYNQRLHVTLFVDRDKFQKWEFSYIPSKEELNKTIEECTEKALKYLRVYG